MVIMWFRKKEHISHELDAVKAQVQDLEERVDSVTQVLLSTIDDPWAQGILRRIHDR